MLIDDGVLSSGEGDGSSAAELTAIAVPPTIQALLAARLDRLDPARARGHRGRVDRGQGVRPRARGGAGGRRRAANRSASTCARSSARTSSARWAPSEDAFRFRHQLIRDARLRGHAEGAARRSARALRGLAGRGRRRRCRSPTSCSATTSSAPSCSGASSARPRRPPRRSRRARRRSLGAAGRRAAQRDDPPAASALLERAVALVESDDAARGALLPALGAALFEAGRIAEAIARARRGDRRARPRRGWRRGRGVEREFVRLEAEPSVGHRARAARRRRGPAGARARGRRPRPVPGLVAARSGEPGSPGRWRSADAAWREAAGCARRAGDERELFAILGWRATAAVLGPTPVDEAIRRCEAFRDVVGASPVAVAWTLNPLASAARDERRLRAGGALAGAGQRDDPASSAAWTSSVSHHRGAREAARGRARRWPSRRCARASRRSRR